MVLVEFKSRSRPLGLRLDPLDSPSVLLSTWSQIELDSQITRAGLDQGHLDYNPATFHAQLVLHLVSPLGLYLTSWEL